MEESDKWKSEVTHSVFDDTHIIQDGIIDAVDFGFASSRRRYWAVLFHREYILKVGNFELMSEID